MRAEDSSCAGIMLDGRRNVWCNVMACNMLSLFIPVDLADLAGTFPLPAEFISRDTFPLLFLGSLGITSLLDRLGC